MGLSKPARVASKVGQGQTKYQSGQLLFDGIVCYAKVLEDDSKKDVVFRSAKMCTK